MRVKRQRTYLLDPRHKNERVYIYAARRHNGFTAVNELGHSRAYIVGHGYGSTPQKAVVDLRKRPKRREPKRPITARELANDRRYTASVMHKFERMTPTFAERERIREFLSCDHEWVATLPQTLDWAERCTKCGTKHGRKAGALDKLADYF